MCKLPKQATRTSCSSEKLKIWNLYFASKSPLKHSPWEPLTWNLRFDNVSQRMIFLVDGEQTSIGYLCVLVNSDPRKKQRQEMENRDSLPPPSLNLALQGRLKSHPLPEAFLSLFIP